ncbi:MAG: DUF1553 domain-containing protein, partial [Planctomycetes bacterium]|nr:DUF1553 domain-containing protein [Planctomycetota bacterium]
VPVVPEALDLLTRDTASHDFDMKRLVRIVTATRAYQTSSAGKDRSAKAQAFFAAGPVKPMTPQQSFDSLSVALGVVHDGRTLALSDAGPSAIEMQEGRGGMLRMMGDDYAAPDRAKVQMAAAAKSFFTTFDDDEQGGDATFEGTVPQGLFLLNSPIVNGMLLNPSVSVVPRIVAQFPDEKSRVRQLFLRTLSREPTAAESTRFVKFVQEYRSTTGAASSQSKRRKLNEDQAAAAYADALWVLISSSEFGSNH